ncbi:erythromycin esterase family protein [Myxococcus sp. CA033]|uniref:erythromycin esterase family protein n=1 Tax=Myxococcus sp. CA033 TaxID=2741516 RepID=UPI00157A9B1C|nr:erythromycin esterase family protein [Myxococcus sp. CA033]NTX32936.1 erythromycin esterase family protein [Myxococcus sp. CA033]
MRFLLLLLSLFLSSCASPARGVAAPGGAVASDADRIVRDLCDKQLALLGEESHHGNGRTIAFKAELTRRLVEECQYDAFFIETGIYDFLHLQALREAGQPVSEDLVATAIGGMWANQEMAPLIPFLSERLKAGTLIAGGIDDQINRGTYAQREMARELIPFLEGPRQAACGEEIERNMSWKYDDAHPYTAEHMKFILGCWTELGAVLSRPGVAVTPRARGQLQMVRSLERNYTRQVAAMSRAPDASGGTWSWSDFDDRSRSMFMNLEWHLAQSARPRKAIVWLATVHAAKDLKGLDADTRHGTSFGSYVQEKFGARAFVLGFSARSGSYSIGSTPRTNSLAPARDDSLEGWAFSGHTGDTRYLDGSQLRDFGPRVARPLNYAWMTAPWATVMDGLLIFREEAPPRPVTRASPAPH